MKGSPSTRLLGFLLLAGSQLFVGHAYSQETTTIPLRHSEPPPPLQLRSEGVSGMKYLSPMVGWVEVGQRLLLTTDNGEHWQDITPPGTNNQIIFKIFFLDNVHGWVLFAKGIGIPSFTLARTEDEGRTWTSSEVETSLFEGLKNIIARPSRLWFSDLQHGWMQWEMKTSSAFSVGRLLATEDGGNTWVELPSPPSAGEFRFFNLQEGWMVGGAASNELWRTYDGGHTWSWVEVPKPSSCKSCRPSYSAPGYLDTSVLAVKVRFSDDSVLRGRYVNTIYDTHDGGNSWHLSEQHERTDSKTELSSITDSGFVHITSDSKLGIEVRTATRKTIAPSPSGLPRRGSVAASDFVDETNGWLVYQTLRCDRREKQGSEKNNFFELGKVQTGSRCVQGTIRNDLVSTTGGGNTFRVITPIASDHAANDGAKR